jgi:hypothetical protein
MKLHIKNSVDFEKLLNALGTDIVNANIFFKHHYNLKSAAAEYTKEFNQSVTFWNITFQALLDATMFALCRIYDTHAKTNSLRNLLDTIKGNLHIFDEADFRIRLKDNPFVGSLAESAEKPDLKQLNEDIEYASDKNPLVNNLRAWRNNILAHKSAKIIIKGTNVPDDFPLSMENIAELLESGMSILNHYSGLFRALSYSTQIVGHDDYRHVLNCIRADLKRREEQFREELKRYG